MFSRFFTSAIDVLAQPVKNNLDSVQENWEKILSVYESFGPAWQHGTLVTETTIPSNLSIILSLVKEDEALRTEKDIPSPPCIDYILQERALPILVEYAKNDLPKGLKLEVTQFFSALISRHPKKILPHLSARRPLLKLLHSYLNSPEERLELKEAHINLLLSIITTLNQNSELLTLFTTIPNIRLRSSNCSEAIRMRLNNQEVKTECCAPVQILLVSLQNYICSSGLIGVHARGAMFELFHLLSSDSESTDLLTKDPTFKRIMLGQLSFLYTSIPTYYNTHCPTWQAFKFYSDDLDSPISERDCSTIDSFSELWKFLNKLLTTTISLYPRISEFLLESIVSPFLNEAVLTGLMNESPFTICSSTMQYIGMLHESSSLEIQNELLSLITQVGPPTEKSTTIPEVSQHQTRPLLFYLAQRIQSDDENIALVSLKLFNALLALYRPEIYAAILPGIFSNSTPNNLPQMLVESHIDRYLTLLKPVTSELPKDIAEFLHLLNPSDLGHDSYFFEAFSDINNSKAYTLYIKQLPKALTCEFFMNALYDEIKVLGSRSYERILLMSDILIRLFKIPSSRITLMALPNASNSIYSRLSSQLYGHLLEALSLLEHKMKQKNESLWNISAIDSAHRETPPLSPSYISSPEARDSMPTTPDSPHIRGRSLTLPGKLSLSPFLKIETNSNSQGSPSYSGLKLSTNLHFKPLTKSDLFCQRHTSHLPNLELLEYVTPEHRLIFLSYLTLQEFCKEIAALLCASFLTKTTF